MINRLTKIVSVVVGVLALLGTTNVSAHGVLSSQSKDVGNYTIVMEATADAPSLFANYPITYDFRLYQKGTDKEVDYDSSYIFLSRKSGALLFQSETPAPRDFLPGSQVIAAVPDVGEYQFEIIFNKKDSKGESNEVKTTFDFSSVKGSIEGGITAPDAKESSSNVPSMYIWIAIALFVVGGVVGRITKRKTS